MFTSLFASGSGFRNGHLKNGGGLHWTPTALHNEACASRNREEFLAVGMTLLSSVGGRQEHQWLAERTLRMQSPPPSARNL